jgi:hypothetical protein
MDSGAPQFTQRFASSALSAPQRAHGVYGSPQCGQNFIALENFFAQFEQKTSRVAGAGVGEPDC